MRVLVDTCGWIEWLIDSPLAERFLSHLRLSEDLIVPTPLQFELYKWVKREGGECAALEVIAVTQGTRIVPLTTTLALTAAGGGHGAGTPPGVRGCVDVRHGATSRGDPCAL